MTWRVLRIAGFAAACLFLTALTQIGGLALVLGWLVVRLLPDTWRGASMVTLASLALYALMTVALVPPLAKVGGREALPCSGTDAAPYRAATPLLCILNRAYVRPPVKAVLAGLSLAVTKEFPGTQTVFLDGNFPFFDGFPLLPHLSHQDGRKLDIAFYYQDAGGRYEAGRLKSPIGYWAFEHRQGDETDACPESRGPTSRWDMAAIQSWFPPLVLEPNRTRAALIWLSGRGTALGVEKIFIEPYLAARWDVTSSVLRFQGCRAARHDDHIHFQVK